MLIAWHVRRRKKAFKETRAGLITRIGVLTVCGAGLVMVPLVARPGSQLGWALVAQVCTVVPVIRGIRDLQAIRTTDRG